MTKAKAGAVIGRPKTEKGKKQDRLAVLIDISRSTIYGLFNGNIDLGYEKAKIMANLVGGHHEVWMAGGSRKLRNYYFDESKI